MTRVNYTLPLVLALSLMVGCETTPNDGDPGASDAQAPPMDSAPGDDSTEGPTDDASVNGPEDGGGGTSDALGGGPEDTAGGEEDPPPADADDAPQEPDPVQAILAVEGDEVIPQTKLHLESSAGDCDGQAVMFKWTVTQPAGHQGVFIPASTFPNPTFQADAAGEYLFELRSYGQDGELCTAPTQFLLSVTPTSLVHIELLWDTPGDPDETDEGPEAGADLDLHVQRVQGDDTMAGWFQAPFDCYWFNPHPNWGDLDPLVDDDPGLDRDDTDGAGPENFNLNALEGDAVYAVMAHAWSDHGYGASIATVRVFIAGELTYESEGVSLDELDGWQVGTFTSDLVFTPALGPDDGPVIVEDLTGLPIDPQP